MASLGHLLTTNQAPSDDERIGLKETVAEYDDQLNAITQKISALEEQLQILNKEKTALLEVSAPYRRALSPFRQLPEDVVRAIFVACLETRWNPTMANTEAPVLLTQISRATRMIALTTPKLWAAIHIPIIVSAPLEVMDTAQSIMTARADGVNEWLLRRSGNLPLHISVYENREYMQMTSLLSSDIIDILIDVLVACCSRWKDVHFSCRPTILSRISPLNQYDVPLLRSLTISVFPDSEEDNLWGHSDILKAPMLKTFRQLGSSAVSLFPVNWTNLTHLYCTQARFENMTDLAHVLRQAAGLVRLDLTVMRSVNGSPVSGPISLPFLTTLVIIEFDMPDLDEIGGIFGSIYAPSLETISYNTKMDRNSRSPYLIECLKRSSNIRELSTGRPSSSDILIEYLSHCPSLLTLHVAAAGYDFDELLVKPNDNAFLSAFIHDDPAQCLCPQLKYFRYEPTLVVSLPTLSDFLVHRNGTIPGLSRLKAVLMNVEYDPIEEPLLKEVRSADIASDTRLEISYHRPIAYSPGLDLGINRAVSSVDDWWPSEIVDDMTYLH